METVEALIVSSSSGARIAPTWRVLTPPKKIERIKESTWAVRCW